MSFMRILMEGEIHKTEEAMLGRNQIDGLLEMVWQKEDKGYLLRYNITGKQALDTILENSMADEQLLVNLIQEICSLCRRLERFLLSREGILLEPELIYWDARTEKFHFCYYPGNQLDFQSKFIHLMEYLLARTNHKSTRAVEMVYGVYETLTQVGDNVNEIQCRLENIRKSWKQEEEIHIQEEVTDIVEVPKDTGKMSLERIRNKLTVWERIKNWMNAWIKPEWNKRIKQKSKTVEFVFEPEEEQERQTTPTILLSSENQVQQGILKYEGGAAQKDIYISKTPFLIGSGEGCDGVINDVTISRKHAVITKVDETYFIEDLNSSNGTKVAGEFIGYRTKISLNRNDCIQFSNQVYRFI